MKELRLALLLIIFLEDTVVALKINKFLNFQHSWQKCAIEHKMDTASPLGLS